MAIVIPIKGLRYNPALISNLKEVDTPYDVPMPPRKNTTNAAPTTSFA